MSILDATEHRPWPLPSGPWIMRMRWYDLLFAHWSLHPSLLRPHIPSVLELDTFEGRAWIGVVPFGMEDVAPRGLPAPPGPGRFLELNVRTYVRCGGYSGVWFFSLDAASPTAVRLARAWFKLPYVDARMSMEHDGEEIAYASERTQRDAPPARFVGRYAPTGEIYRSLPGTLEHWLTERYALFSVDGRGRPLIGHIHHLPWPLQPARAAIEVNTMTEQIGVALPKEEPLLHFVRSIDVVGWGPRVVEL